MVFGNQETGTNAQLQVIVSKINEIYEREQKDILSLTEYIKTLEAKIIILEKKEPKSYDDEINTLNDEVEYAQNNFQEVRKIMLKTMDLLHTIALEKGMIEPPKPKTTEDKISDLIEQVSSTSDMERKEKPEEYAGYCLNCARETPTVNIEIKPNSPFARGKCGICGERKNIKIKKR